METKEFATSIVTFSFHKRQKGSKQNIFTFKMKKL